MIKSKLDVRRKFIKDIIDNSEATAEYLEMLAISLKNTRKTDEKFRIASELLHLSEQTILNDYLA